MPDVYALTQNKTPVKTYTADEINAKIAEASSGGDTTTFDMLAEQKGNQVRTTFPSASQIVETITNSGGNVAIRTTTFNSNGTITEKVDYYENGAVSKTATATTTFSGDGSITENVV